jgi:hypothetical protein
MQEMLLVAIACRQINSGTLGACWECNNGFYANFTLNGPILTWMEKTIHETRLIHSTKNGAERSEEKGGSQYLARASFHNAPSELRASEHLLPRPRQLPPILNFSLFIFSLHHRAPSFYIAPPPPPLRSQHSCASVSSLSPPCSAWSGLPPAFAMQCHYMMWLDLCFHLLQTCFRAAYSVLVCGSTWSRKTWAFFCHIAHNDIAFPLRRSERFVGSFLSVRLGSWF